jgi:hypothetical protein
MVTPPTLAAKVAAPSVPNSAGAAVFCGKRNVSTLTASICATGRVLAALRNCIAAAGAFR